MSWSALPVELIVRILEALDPQTLVKCRRLSHLFKSLVDETITLQYPIALYSSGMIDGPPGQLSTSERLSLLRSYEASWKKLDWNAHTSLPVPEGGLWELFGNVWAHSKGDDTIFFVQLPSRLRGIPMRQWSLRLSFAPRDFGMDPAQDLLVTVERVTNASLLCRVRLLSLSSGETHPLARDTGTPTLEYTRAVPENPHIRWSYSIRVSGDYVGILFINDDIDDDNDGNELVVWNWKTGARNLSLTLVQMLSFTFLGNEFVLAAASAFDLEDDMQPALLLYDLNPGPSRSVINPDAYLLRFLFQTPPPAQGSPAIFLTSDPSPDWSSSPDLHVPFQIPCDERIIAVNLHRFYLGDSRSETFLIPAQELLGHVGNITVGGEGRDIEWKEWGSSCAEPVRHHGRWSSYTCFVFGMRHVMPMAAVRDDRHVMIVRDLCPKRCMRASEEERSESDALHDAMGCEGQYPLSIVRCVPLPANIRESSDVHLMISEDGIVVLENDHKTGNNLVHLLTF